MGPGTDEKRHPRAPNEWGGLALAGLHLFALVGFAVVQPLLDVLGQDATFFVARRSQPADLIALALGPAVLLPLALLLVEAAALPAGRAVRRGVHLVFVAALVAAVALPLCERLGLETGGSLALAFAAGALASLAYARLAPVRTFLTVLSPAPLLFAALFLLDPSVAKLLRSGGGSPRPEYSVASDTTVVVVILDELPVTSLVDEAWEIDARLFPNFARLASRSTWFHNATTNHNNSEHAVPTLLTGVMPADVELLPLAADYPHNLFSLFSGSHRMNVWETFTGLWPRASEQGFGERARSLADDALVVYGHIVLPGALAAGLPDVQTNWGAFRADAPLGEPPDAELADVGHGDLGAGERGLRNTPFGGASYTDRTSVFRGFIESIEASDGPALHFLHTIFPHSPWERLPTGQVYTSKDPLTPGRVQNAWVDDDWLAGLAFQRHLLQVGHIDTLLGELLDRLEAQGLFDESLVVLVADHGVCFRKGQRVRGEPQSLASTRDVLHVPLFVKEPFQTEGRIDDGNVQAVDVLPTIAGALGVRLPFDVDGSSALDPARVDPPEKTLYFRTEDEPVTLPAAMPRNWPPLKNKLRFFGFAPGWEGVYAMGPHPEVLGRSVQDLELAAPLSARLDLIDEHRFELVDTGAESLPVLVEGRIFAKAATGREPAPPPAEIAVSINGTVRAVASTYGRSATQAEFSVLVAPEALASGRNAVEVFGLVDGERLAPIQGVVYTLESNRIAGSDGRVFELRPEAFDAAVERASAPGTRFVLSGWAADVEAGLPAETMLLFLDGSECLFRSPPNKRRRELEESLERRSGRAGFRFVLDFGLSPDEVSSRVRLFALRGSSACELRLD